MSIISYFAAHICRICECETNENNLRLDRNMEILKRLRACANVSIDVNDELPKFVCRNCIVELNNSYKFKIKCEFTYQKLRFFIEAGMTLNGNGELTEKQQCHNTAPHYTPTLNNIVENSGNNMLHPNDNLISLTIEEKEECTAGAAGAAGAAGIILTPIEEDGEEQIAENVQINENVILNGQISPKSKHLNANCCDRMQITETEQNIEDLSHSSFDGLTNECIVNSIAVKGINNKIDCVETVKRSSPNRRCSVHIVRINDNSNVASTSRTEDNDCGTTLMTSESQAPYADTITNCASKSTRVRVEETSTEQSACDYESDERPFDSNNRGNSMKKKKSYLRQHKSTPFKCNICMRELANKQGFNLHMKTHMPRERSYACDICQKAFTSKEILLYHNWIHSETSPECSTCGKTCSNPSNVLKHKKLHLLKPFLCDICKKMYKTKREMKMHMRVHASPRTLYDCDICKKTFTVKGSLQQHKLIHNRNGPSFDCTICSKTFNRIYNLKIHINTHVMKPFLCDICEKMFESRRDIRIHMLVHGLKYK